MRKEIGNRQAGFTLVEMLVTMVIALVIMAGLLLSFQSQYKEYKYQNKRSDAVQDLEFALRFIADELRTGMWSASADTNAAVAFTAVSGTLPAGVTTDATANMTFWSWDETATGVNADSARAQRKILFDFNNETLNYDRIIATIDSSGAYSTTGLSDTSSSASSELLRNVTFFKVFQDGVTSRSGYSGIPTALGSLNLGVINEDGFQVGTYNNATIGKVEIKTSTAGGVDVPAYTILLEVAVDASYKEGTFYNSRGTDVRTFETPARKRVWRYIQVHPRILMP